MHILFGTRPDAIKMAPVIRAMQNDSSFDVIRISTGQHKEMLIPLLKLLDIKADHELDVMVRNQTLCELNSALTRRLGLLVHNDKPDLVIVHGDTATAFAGAMVAFYQQVPLAHVEAGIRSGSMSTPFPEEFHRCAITRLARWHLAPTETTKQNLLAEGVNPDRISVTGNTAIDSLMWVMGTDKGRSAFQHGALRNILVTMHRRESQDWAIGRVARNLTKLAAPDTEVLFLLHKSPGVRKSLLPLRHANSAARLLEPLEYPDFVRTLAEADLVLTDSGGVQDEAAAFGKRILVLRERTDRPEAVEAGYADVIGLDPENVLDCARRELAQRRPRSANVSLAGPFGDGHSADRIVEWLSKELARDALST